MGDSMKKVIIIDDSAMARMFTRRCLEMAGLECERITEYESAKDAMSTLMDPDVDLMIVDLVMPGVTGKHFLQMRKNSGAKATAIVVSSAVNATVEKELKELGASLILKKPITPAAAAQAIAIAEEALDAR